MSISIKPRIAVVKVMAPLGENASDRPATVYARGGKNTQRMHLSPEAKVALGGDLFGFFEAELVDGHWWLGKRLPDGDRGW